MNTSLAASLLAVLGGAAALLMPNSSHAGNVGYFNGCPEYSGSLSGVVATAGHNPVTVTTLDTASLSGLSALVITDCQGRYRTPNAAVNNAVANGMGLVFERLLSGDRILEDSTSLPGAPIFGPGAVRARPVANDNVDVAAGAPIATGPGGTLDNSSLDYVSGPTFYNMVYFYSSGSLPAGAIPFLTTPDPSQVGSFGYTFGNGKVVYSDSQYTLQLPGSPASGAGTTNFAAAGATFLANAVAWAAGPTTTCASEGYTGMKLEWCRNVCEKDYTGTQLKTWIRRWMDRYHDLPYCMREDEETPPHEQGAF